jgi:hypothetical protein
MFYLVFIGTSVLYLFDVWLILRAALKCLLYLPSLNTFAPLVKLSSMVLQPQRGCGIAHDTQGRR